MGIKCPKCQFNNPDDTVYCGKCAAPLKSPEEISVTKTLITPAERLQKGSTIAGKYQILEELGRGGMGVVYKAKDTKLKRTVALKFLPPELTHISEVKERFMREAQAAAALDHPNICTVHEFDEAEDKTFISMAYVEGQSLKKKIESGPLEIDEALSIATQVAAGLQEAHNKGVVHRDIKSANIMVTEKGLAKIMDFGLARLAGGTLVTKEGTTMGTIAYMSPEQARGEEVDHRTDIWSLGVVLYEIFSGQLPFKGEHEQAVVYSILKEKPGSIINLRPNMPMSIEQVVCKALEKNRDERYQQIEDLLDDLKSISEGIVPERVKARLRRAKLLRRKRAILYAGIAGFLIIMTVIALSLFTGRAEVIDSIAVLPLDNLTGDAEQEYFVDGVTDELIGQLAQISALRVISRRSVMQYKKSEKSLPEIARELSVDAVVEGAVHQVGESVRIRVQLIDALPEERNLWAQTYDRAMTDVLAMYGEMSRAILGEMQVKLTVEETARIASARQVNPEAYDAYLKGQFHWGKLYPKDLEIALQYYELALEKDPNYALAYAGIAQTWSGLMQMGAVPAHEAGPRVKAAAMKALELDSTLAEAHYTLAVFRTWTEWDWEGAETAFRQAIALNPNYPDARAFYSHLLAIMNRPDEAIAQMNRALELDPFNALFQSLNGAELMFLQRYDEAIAQFQKVLSTVPNHGVALNMIWITFHNKGMYEEALAGAKAWYAAAGYREVEEALARGYAEGGYRRAMSCAAEALEARSGTTYVLPWEIAELYVLAGKNDRALEWIERSVEARDPNIVYIGVFPEFDSLQDDPRFKDLLRRMNLPEQE
jgi:TolB-like protein/tRNA A-37 threonylcarbamoyl transferase component Bud32/Tfp pilus assembly protein PilF